MDYLKLIFVGLFTGIVVLVGSAFIPSDMSFGATDITTISNRTVFSDDVTMNDPVTITDNITVDTIDFVLNTSGDTIAIGTTTTSGSDVAIVDAPAGLGSPASTTLKIGNSATTTSRAQFEMQQQDGGVSCIFVNSAGTAFILVDGVCNQ